MSGMALTNAVLRTAYEGGIVCAAWRVPGGLS